MRLALDLLFDLAVKQEVSVSMLTELFDWLSTFLERELLLEELFHTVFPFFRFLGSIFLFLSLLFPRWYSQLKTSIFLAGVLCGICLAHFDIEVAQDPLCRFEIWERRFSLGEKELLLLEETIDISVLALVRHSLSQGV